MKTLYLHQLHDHLRSLRLQMGFVLLLLVFALNGLIQVWRFEQVRRDEASLRADMDSHFQHLETVADVVSGYKILLPLPQSMAIVDGGSEWFDDSMEFSVGTASDPPHTDRWRSQNNWMQRYEELDWSLIVRLVLSFLALALAYDSVAGERERGTLRLVFANPVSRARFLVAKYLGALTPIAASLLVASLVSVAILSLGGAAQVTLSFAAAYGLFVVASLIYASIFILLAIAASALSRSSASSLVVLMLAWTGLVIIIPQSAYLAAVSLRPQLPPWWEVYWGPVGDAYDALARDGIVGRDGQAAAQDGYRLEKLGAQRMSQVEAEQFQALKQRESDIVSQYQLARQITAASPASSFQFASEDLLGTGLPRYRSFEAAGWRYFEGLRTFVAGLDAQDPASPHVLYYSEYMSRRPIDRTIVPRFDHAGVSRRQAVLSDPLPAVVLLLEALIALFTAQWAVQRMEL